MKNYFFEDFTESAYRELLCIAKIHWEFIDYTSYQKPDRVCLWRHDLDLSIQRAYKLAQIEAEEGVKATYFILLHSEFYNAFEKENVNLIRKILDLGHYLGLHFDPSFYISRLNNGESLLEFLKFEQQILEKTFQTDVGAFSFHNPDVGDWLNIDQDIVGGLINTYGRYLRDHYSYCSDSNGYWRFHRLRDTLEQAEAEKLQVLTHPGWWVSEPMSPRDRILRCVEGRAARTTMRYDQTLAEAKRENVR